MPCWISSLFGRNEARKTHRKGTITMPRTTRTRAYRKPCRTAYAMLDHLRIRLAGRHEHDVEHREDQEEHAEQDGDCTGLAHGEAVEGPVVDHDWQGLCGPRRSALGQQPDHVEDLERPQGSYETHHVHHRLQLGHGDVEEALGGVGSVDLGRLVQLAGYALKTCQYEEREEGEPPPRVDHDHRGQSPLRRAQEVYGGL